MANQIFHLKFEDGVAHLFVVVPLHLGRQICGEIR